MNHGKGKKKSVESKHFIFYVIAIAECLRTDCNILGDKIQKKNYVILPHICPAFRQHSGSQS